ncbi:MAG: polysaccharide biosynthesis/export family protein, partial [Hyphomicrobiaceae bacterium]
MTTSGIVPASDDAQARAAQKIASEFTAASTPGSMAYKIGPQDVLDVSVFKVPELSKTVQVAEVGTVNLPLVGEIPAAGRTARDVEQDLTQKLGAKYLQNPQVTVLLKEYNSQRATIGGQVRKPGVFEIRGRLTLIQLIAKGGGLTPASDSTVVVFRTTNGKRSVARFDLSEIRDGKTPDP